MMKKEIAPDGGVEVSFLPNREITSNAKEVFLAGDFNKWSEDKTPLEEGPDGQWSITIKLPPNTKIEFRYFIHYPNTEPQWHNDWFADEYIEQPFHDTNSVCDTSKID